MINGSRKLCWKSRDKIHGPISWPRRADQEKRERSTATKGCNTSRFWSWHAHHLSTNSTRKPRGAQDSTTDISAGVRSQLPDWDADLLENTEGDDQSPVSNLKDVLQTSKPILLVSGGGVRSTSVGSFGWVVATSFTKLWSGMGKARGYPMTSNRAEVYGRLAGLLFLKRYTEFISISCPTNTLVSWCDNKQIVKWCDMEQDPYHSGCWLGRHSSDPPSNKRTTSKYGRKTLQTC